MLLAPVLQAAPDKPRRPNIGVPRLTVP
jgi:hypothetical protein